MACDDAVGTHVLVALRNVQRGEALDSVDDLRSAMDQVVRACDLHVVAEAGHQFQPRGATYVYVLSESHFSCHTYPERRSAYVDLFCCSADFDALHAVQVIRDAFVCDVSYQVVHR